MNKTIKAHNNSHYSNMDVRKSSPTEKPSVPSDVQSPPSTGIDMWIVKESEMYNLLLDVYYRFTPKE